MAKDRTPDANRSTGGSPRGASTRGGSSARGAGAAKGRTRPPANVVTAPRRPWGLIAASIAVVLFAVAAIGYAVAKARQSEAGEIEDPSEIAGVETFEYEGAQHTPAPVDYTESPPVGGEHDDVWADCTGTVYDVDIRHENAVHALEHGAVWITYNPDDVSDADIQTLTELVDGESGRMLSPYEGQDSPISLQSWNHQLKVDSADDPRVEQYADFFTYNADFYPEPGASCERPDFLSAPRLETEDGQAPADGSAESSAPATDATEPTSTTAQ